jgi:hypothetical protein
MLAYSLLASLAKTDGADSVSVFLHFALVFFNIILLSYLDGTCLFFSQIFIALLCFFLFL